MEKKINIVATEDGWGYEVKGMDARTAVHLLEAVKLHVLKDFWVKKKKDMSGEINLDDLPPNIRKRFGMN